MFLGLLLLAASCAGAEDVQRVCEVQGASLPASCTVRTELLCSDKSIELASTSPTRHERSRRRLYDLTSALGSWKVFDAVSSSFAQFHDYIMEGLLLLSNLMFVVLMGVGFAVLPRKLMLIIALVGVFGPMFFAWVSVALFHGSADTVVELGPLLVEAFLGVIVLAFTVAMTTPGLAVLAMWVIALASSQIFQWALQKMGLDLNDDGKVGWRDLLVAIIRLLKSRCGDSWIYAFALDELYDSASKSLRAVKQNAEILERVERLEAMLIVLGAHQNLDLDLREAQKRDLDGLIDSTSVNFKATVKAHNSLASADYDFDAADVRNTGSVPLYTELREEPEADEEKAAGAATSGAKKTVPMSA